MQIDPSFSTVVLIADNNDYHYLPMEETLLQEGYVVERVRSSEDALLRCSMPPPVHIALVDASLPGKNGHLLTQQPRPADHPPLTFILMSGFSLAAVSLAVAWGCYVLHGKRLILTMAPETAFVQGGMAAYTGMWGAYLPVIQALRDSLEILHVQLYNSGGTYGINHVEYQQGTADFIVAMTEAVIKGFSTAGGTFDGLPASKVAVSLPACPLATGGGFVDTATVMAAMSYLLGKGPKPGTYSLVQAGGYPTLRGMMTWSVNWDVVTACATRYQYANNYQRIFAPPILVKSPNGGENLPRGTAYNITWDDAIPENVKIDLFNGAVMALEISASIPSTGTFVWNIPASLETGADYKIRISSIVNGDISDLSNTDFNIVVNSGITEVLCQTPQTINQRRGLLPAHKSSST
ncbi:MAG: Ser-Thr-rich GPI-anchored membrane family protein [Bacteroidota bacterium]